MKSEPVLMKKLAIVGIGSLVLLAGCGGATVNYPPPPHSPIPTPASSGCNPISEPLIPAMGPLSVAVAPDPSGKFGKFAYVANRYAECVSMYTIDPTTGALTSNGTISTGVMPFWVAVDPSGKFVYVVGGGVLMYTINATTGTLTPTGTIIAGNYPESVAVHPSGKFAYVANLEGCSALESGDVSMYAIDAATGILRSTGTIGAGVCPWSVAVDPSGKFAYVANRGDCDSPGVSNVSMYRIDAATGSLSATGTVDAGECPVSVTTDPSGRFAYVANEAGNVSMYMINPMTGALTSTGTITAGNFPESVAVHPSGKFAYVANSGSNNVSMFTINAATGVLSSIGMIPAEMSPWSIAIDPSGTFAYVANFASNSTSIYSVDTATGVLTSTGRIGA